MKHNNELLKIAQKYVWWKTPQETLSDQKHFLAQVMTIGVLEDCFWLLDFLGVSAFVDAIKTPPVGVFNNRAWAFWHYKLELIEAGGIIPSLPKRKMVGRY